MAGLLIPAIVDMTGHYLGSSVRRSSLWWLLPGSSTVLQPLVPPLLLGRMSSLYQRLQQMWLSPLSGSVPLEHPAVGWLNMMQLLPQQHIRTEISPPKFEGNLPMKGTLAPEQERNRKICEIGHSTKWHCGGHVIIDHFERFEHANLFTKSRRK